MTSARPIPRSQRYLTLWGSGEPSTSMQYIETVTAKPVLGLAYPYGQSSPEAEKVAQECGYLFARTTREGQTSFPPQNPYAWGIGVYASTRDRPLYRKLPSWRMLFSNRARLYFSSLTIDWSEMALRLLERARRENGVWHLFGHASEVLRTNVKDKFLEICKYVAKMNDLWFPTNGELFLNEAIKNHVCISQCHRESGTIFRIDVPHSREIPAGDVPIPLRLMVPEGWPESYEVTVKTSSRRFEMGRIGRRQVWINLFDRTGVVEVASG